ncbi:hypothetical protein WT66_28165 [Burkholderia stagnalis]|nr:hypothetical protein WT18_13745 [Burkholderia stagnalis]KVP11773.1 hypothetical protein WT20_13970 [Burkholderia stagnalis]KVW88888.1 hypothetical protein WT30_31955 [Burkholderia stagnalis]KWH70717.1 hypothetical protein WT66_28165 [Burkholderia stagnalis]
MRQADTCARIAGDVAAQVAARDRLPAGLIGTGRCVLIALVFLLPVGLPGAVVGMCWRCKHQ